MMTILLTQPNMQHVCKKQRAETWPTRGLDALFVTRTSNMRGWRAMTGGSFYVAFRRAAHPRGPSLVWWPRDGQCSAQRTPYLEDDISSAYGRHLVSRTPTTPDGGFGRLIAPVGLGKRPYRVRARQFIFHRLCRF